MRGKKLLLPTLCQFFLVGVLNADHCDFRYGDECFVVSKYTLNWLDAVKFCRHENDGNLVKIRDKGQSNFISEQLVNLNYDQLWIGMNDFSQRGKFNWLKPGLIPFFPGFTNWAYGFPDPKLAVSCVVLDPDFGYDDALKWRNIDCNHHAYALCEVEDDDLEKPDGGGGGGWSPWSSWSFCSELCGQGTRSRSRVCSKPSPNNCFGSDHEIAKCDYKLCTIAETINDAIEETIEEKTSWSQWGSWSSCSDCQQQRRRICPADPLIFCPGSDVENRTCDTGFDCRKQYSKLMVVGGISGRQEDDDVIYHHEVEVIDLNDFPNRKTCVNPPNYPIGSASTGAYFNGVPLVCGGRNESFHTNECYEYNLQANEWQFWGNMTSIRSDAAGQLISEDQWWISGGFIDADSRVTSETLESGSTFEPFVGLPREMFHHTMVRINDTLIIFVGFSRDTKEVYMFNTQTQNFSPLPQMSEVRFGCQAGLIKDSNGRNQFVVHGGFDENNFVQSTTEILDLESMQWTTPDSNVHFRALGASVPYKDTFLAVGGVFSETFTQFSIYEFNPLTNEWVFKDNLSNERRYLTAFLVPDEALDCFSDGLN